jgi:hypothetical protein
MVDNKELESGLKVMAEDFHLPGGGHKKLSQLVAGHMHWFDAAERRGMGWRDMIRALTAAGVNGRGGKRASARDSPHRCLLHNSSNGSKEPEAP